MKGTAIACLNELCNNSSNSWCLCLHSAQMPGHPVLLRLAHLSPIGFPNVCHSVSTLKLLFKELIKPVARG